MKYFFVVTSILVFLLALTWNPTPVDAQGDGQCASDISDWEGDTVKPLVQAFEQVGADTNTIETVANLQALRREFDGTDAPSEAYEVKALYVRMADLKTDAVVASIQGDENLAEDLLDDAQKAGDKALALLADLCPGQPPQITSPEAGTEVEHNTIIDGTYDPASLGDNQLWVAVLAQTGRFFPQVIMDANCDEETASSVTYGPQPGTWRVTAFIGGEGSAYNGQSFDIVLYIAEPEEHKAMLDLMAKWCKNQDFPGLTDVSSPPYGFEFVQTVRVTRK